MNVLYSFMFCVFNGIPLKALHASPFFCLLLLSNGPFHTNLYAIYYNNSMHIRPFIYTFIGTVHVEGGDSQNIQHKMAKHRPKKLHR